MDKRNLSVLGESSKGREGVLKPKLWNVLVLIPS